mgnify:CR=1 FL=1
MFFFFFFCVCFFFVFFFFQAEDGIRDVAVTGVQTCALPIYSAGREFNFDVLAADQITGADIYKSNSALLQEGGIGGTVNVTTADRKSVV